MRRLIIGLAGLAVLSATPSLAAPAKASAEAEADYGRNLISVATPGRSSKYAPTGDCIVWINAEGLGVGPAQLEGQHGMVLHINEKPIGGEAPTPFAAGLAAMSAAYPKTPAWLTATVEKNKAAIEARCAEDHADPVKVHAITAADKTGK